MASAIVILASWAGRMARGRAVGLVAEMLTAGLNLNCGGRNHIGIELERQLAAAWRRNSAFCFRRAISVTGTSQANFIGVLAARRSALGETLRERVSGAPLTAYTSAEAHGCVAQALEMAGLGRNALRSIVCDFAGRIRPDLLRAGDPRRPKVGMTPFLIVGTAGTVNFGAFTHWMNWRQSRPTKAFGCMSMALRRAGDFFRRFAAVAVGRRARRFDWLRFPQMGSRSYDCGFILARDGDS